MRLQASVFVIFARSGRANLCLGSFLRPLAMTQNRVWKYRQCSTELPALRARLHFSYLMIDSLKILRLLLFLPNRTNRICGLDDEHRGLTQKTRLLIDSSRIKTRRLHVVGASSCEHSGLRAEGSKRFKESKTVNNIRPHYRMQRAFLNFEWVCNEDLGVGQVLAQRVSSMTNQDSVFSDSKNEIPCKKLVRLESRYNRSLIRSIPISIVQPHENWTATFYTKKVPLQGFRGAPRSTDIVNWYIPQLVRISIRRDGLFDPQKKFCCLRFSEWQDDSTAMRSQGALLPIAPRRRSSSFKIRQEHKASPLQFCIIPICEIGLKSMKNSKVNLTWLK